MKGFLIKIYYYIKFFVIFNLCGYFKKAVRLLFKDKHSLYKLKNKHRGSRCFIVATGPSLRIEDVEKLKNEITFSLNSVFLLLDKTNWRSTYYVCTDDTHLSKMIETYGDEIDVCCKEEKFFNIISKKKIDNLDISRKEFISISQMNQLEDDKDEKFYFSKDLLKGIYASGTVANIAIIIAMYMGFKEIYLLGVDCDYSKAKKHIIEDFKDKSYTNKETDYIEKRMRNGYRLIKKEIEKRGVKVYNATRGGALETFERVNFDDIKF